MIKEHQRDEELREKRKVEIYGGRAGYNSVSFTGVRYQVLSRFKNGKITTGTRLNNNLDKKINIIISKIPFVRSFSMVIELIIQYWRRFIIAAIVLFLMEFIFIEKSNSIFLYTMPINGLEMMLCLLVMAGLIIKVSPIGAYHAAEHQTSTAYERKLVLTVEKVKTQPRTHKDCGTNLVISFLICFSVLFSVFGDEVWVYFVSWSIGYELWKNEPKIVWGSIVVIGKVAQYLLFTSKPTEKHLVVAIEAITKLEKVELANEE